MTEIKRKRGSGSKEGTGRKEMFARGPSPLQHYAALLLALGKKPMEVAGAIKMSYESIRNWQTYKQFNELVTHYRKQFIQKIKDEGFDDLRFLTDTMIESLKSPAHRSDGLRARELLAKIRGEFSPEEMNLRIKKELEKLPHEDLKKLEQEAITLDANSTITINPRRNPKKGK